MNDKEISKTIYLFAVRDMAMEDKGRLHISDFDMSINPDWICLATKKVSFDISGIDLKSMITEIEDELNAKKVEQLERELAELKGEQ